MSVVAVTLSGMVRELPSTLRYLAQRQCGVVSRSQAVRAGLSPGMIKFRVRSGQWQQLHPGVYATFTGVPRRGAWLWAAVLSQVQAPRSAIGRLLNCTGLLIVRRIRFT
jgi:hypothetical protein